MNPSRLLENLSMRAAPVGVLCLYGSPRIRGNSDRLLDAFVAGVAAAGGTPEPIYLRNLKISPCREIYACERTGRCALDDDMQPLYERLRDAEALVLASPVMFYSVPGHTKAFIDRCQALWCLRYRRGERVARGPLRVRRGVFLGVGGSRGEKLFEGPQLTFRYFLDTLEAEPWKSLTYRSVDEKGDIERHPTALAEARQLGAALVERVRTDLAESTGASNPS